jgi:hypothetical protein
MSRDLLKRLEKVEERMNPPEPPPRQRFVVVFINPDRTVHSRVVFGPDEPIGGRRIFGREEVS